MFKYQTNRNVSRRQFIKKMVIAGSLFPFAKNISFTGDKIADEKPLEVHIFSKYLQFLDYREMAEMAAEIGFDGVDLSVRAGGHVLPKNVTEDLPWAVEAIRQAGLKASMITTNVLNPEDRIDRKVLEIASDSDILYYRMDYFRYRKGESIPSSIQHFRQLAKALGEMNRELGIVGCYQNHAGDYMGASIWELWQLLGEADHNFLGVQYDIRHAMVEGWLSWKSGFRLIQPWIKTLAIKDFTWEKQDDKWHVKNTPLGEGVVDFKTYFRILKKYEIQVPVSLHYEYPLGGEEHETTELVKDQKTVYSALKRDLQKLREMWNEA